MVSFLLRNPKMKQRKIGSIFFATNTISISGLKSLLKFGIHIQSDIQVICFDETNETVFTPFISVDNKSFAHSAKFTAMEAISSFRYRLWDNIIKKW